MAVEYPPNCQPIQNTNNTSDLVKKLRALSESLQNSDTNDDCKTPDRYRDLAAHLASRAFLDNNSSDVQIWLACCLADVFRIFSPQVPFGDPAQLRDVLIFMARSLRGLDSPGGALFRRYFYLLENLSACNTLHLALELPGEESCIVIKYLIKCTMDIVNGKEWARERESSEELEEEADSMDSEREDKSDRKERSRFVQMQQLLLTAITKLIGEVDQVTIPVLDAIFFYLINPQKSNYRESYAMARSIVQTANASLDVPVENLLTRSLLTGSFLPECEMVGSNRQKLYEVIIELYDAMPSLVVPVIPQIGHFLKDLDAESRFAAVKAVGVMVRNPKSRLYEDYPDVWSAYLERGRDTDPKIRSTFAKNSLHILLNNSQLRGPVCDAVCRLLKDPADEVRLDAFNTAFEAARRKLDSVNEDLVTVCCEKMFDPKANIRQEAISKLLQLHSKVIMGEEYTVSDRQVVSVIPVYALRLYRNPDSNKEDKVMVERLFSAFIIPYKMDTERRIKWMIELHEKLGRVESEVLVSIFLRNAAYRRLTREILFAIKGDADTEAKGKEIENRIERIAKEQPDHMQFSFMLRKLTNLLTEDNKVFESLYHTVGSDYTCAKVANAVASFISSVAEAKAKFNKEEHTMVRHFVERLAPLILDKDGAEILVQCVIRADGDFTIKKPDSETRLAKMLFLLRNLADAYPHVFTNKNVVEKLLKLLRSDTAKTVETTLSVFLFVGSQQKARELAADWLHDVTSAVWGLVTTEQPEFGRVAKLAVRVLCKLELKADLVGQDGKFLQVAEELEQRLYIDHPACVNALRALSTMHRASPDDFAQKFNELSTTVIVPLILSADMTPDDPKTLDLAVEEFVRLKVPKYTYVKIHAMKLLSRSLTGRENMDGLAKKTMKMFTSFIQSNGNIHDEVMEICPVECAMMRAVAGSCILRLTYYPRYLKMMTTDQFVVLSRLMTDSAECVRRYFSDRLFKGIQRNKLVVEFIALFALPSLLRNGAEGDEVIHKYLDECRIRLKAGILRRAQMIRCSNIAPGNAPFYQPEYSIAYAIFLLATQPILTSHKDVENLAFLQECIWFLMDAYVQNKTHFDFELMYRSLQEVRQSTSIWAIERVNEDEMERREAEELNKKMWALADLALCMLMYRAKIVIKNEPGDTQLVKFFKKMKQTNDPIYAPQELIKAEELRQGKAPTERKRGMNGTTTTSSKAGRTKASTTRAPSKKKKKVEVIEEDYEEEDEIVESDEEEVMPAPSKRRGLSVRNSAPSTSNGGSPSIGDATNRRSDASNGSPKKSPKKPPTHLDSPKSLKKRSHAAMVATTSGSTNGLPEPLDKKTRLSLEDLPFSPIAKDGSMTKRTMHFPKGLVASTPLTKPTGSARARKLAVEDALPEEDEEEMEVEEKSPPTRTRRGDVSEAPKPSPKKQETKVQEKRPSRGGTRGRASSPPKEEEDEEMEEEPVKKALPAKRGKRGSAANKKEEEEEKEDEEPVVEKKTTRRSGKKSDVVEKKAPPARKSAGKDAKNKKTEKEERDGEEEEVKRPGRRASARKSNASPAKKKAPARKGAPEESEKDEDDDEEEVEEKKETTGKRASRASTASKKTAAKKTEEKEDEAEDGEEDEKEEEEKKETSKKAKAAPATKKAPAKKNEPKVPAGRASRRQQGSQPSSSAASSPVKSAAAAATTRSSRRKK